MSNNDSNCREIRDYDEHNYLQPPYLDVLQVFRMSWLELKCTLESLSCFVEPQKWDAKQAQALVRPAFTPLPIDLPIRASQGLCKK